MEKLIAQGAEAKLLQISPEVLLKDRISKGYRLPELDKKIRKRRTKREAKILQKAANTIPVPKILKTDDKEKIEMEFIPGLRLSEHLDNLENRNKIAKTIGQQIAALHDIGIIHGDLTTSNMILSEDQNKITCKQSLKERIDKLNLPKDQYALFGSSPLFIRNIRDSDDIDIIVRKGLWDDLKEKHSVEDHKIEDRSIRLIKIEDIEIYQEWGPWFKEPEKLIDNSEVFDDIPFVNLSNLIKWKTACSREKDKKDLELISKYLANNKLYFIDFGLSFHSDKIEDKATDLHLIKQALEAKHFAHFQELFDKVLEGYKSSPESDKVLKRLEAVEKRGRYKAQY